MSAEAQPFDIAVRFDPRDGYRPEHLAVRVRCLICAQFPIASASAPIKQRKFRKSVEQRDLLRRDVAACNVRERRIISPAAERHAP